MGLRRELSRRALFVLVGCTVCQLGAGLFYASQALAPDVLGETGWSRTVWSSAMPIMLFVSSVAQAFVGAACVRFGVRPVLVAAVVTLGGSFVVYAGMQEVWHYYLAATGLALANAGIGDVAIGAVVTRWFQRARSLALGIALCGSNLGAVLFIHLIGTLSEGRSWREAALRIGLLGVGFILPFALFVVREPRPGEASEAEDVDAPGEPGAPVEASTGVSETLAQALRRPIFWVLFLGVFSYALAQLGMTNHLVLYLVDLGYPDGEARLAMEFTVGFGIAAKLGAGAVALRLSAHRALVANTTLLVAAFALLPFVGDPRLLGVFSLCFGIATAARDVLIPLVVVRAFGTREFAKIFGCLMLAYFPGGGLGPMALGLLHDLTGSYQLGFSVLAGLFVVVAVGLMRLRL